MALKLGGAATLAIEYGAIVVGYSIDCFEISANPLSVSEFLKFLDGVGILKLRGGEMELLHIKLG